MNKRVIIISFINWKGGVGKTTTSINVAAELAYRHKKKVLFVDVDPQATGSIYLYTKYKYEREYFEPIAKAIKSGLREDEALDGVIRKSVHSVFLDGIRGTSEFSRDEGIKRGVAGIYNLDLLPSIYTVVELDSTLAIESIKMGVSPFEVLYGGFERHGLVSDYDFIIIDCPPNLGVSTLNAVFASDYYIIPTIPDTLSSTGIPLLVRKLKIVKERKLRAFSRVPKLLGIVYTQVSHQLRKTQEPWMNEIIPFMLREFKREGLVWEGARIFDTRITQKVAVQKATEENKPLCVSSQKNTPSAGEFESLTREILSMIGEDYAKVS